MTTDIDIDAIRRREQAADSGPWRVVEEHGRDIADEAYHRLTIQTDIRHGESREIAEMVDPDHDWASKLSEENAEFIAHARQDILALLAEIERLRGELAAQQQVIAAAKEWRDSEDVQTVGVDEIGEELIAAIDALPKAAEAVAR